MYLQQANSTVPSPLGSDPPVPSTSSCADNTVNTSEESVDKTKTTTSTEPENKNEDQTKKNAEEPMDTTQKSEAAKPFGKYLGTHYFLCNSMK